MGGCERLARFYREQWAGGGHYLAYCALGNYQDASPIIMSLHRKARKRTFDLRVYESIPN